METDLPLESEWTQYAHYNSGSTNYNDSYITLGKFKTIIQFWNLYNNVPSATLVHTQQLHINSRKIVAYSIFKDSIKPEWEDPINSQGSEWGLPR